MFETTVHRALARPHDPPLDVWVELGKFYKPWLKQADSPGVLVEEKGLSFPLRLPGVLHGWLRSRRGPWLALVSYSLPTNSGVGPLRLQHLLPRQAVSRRWPNDEVPY
ncbi:hypothetical protein FKR81_04430 [Lentzea tibetensis]|uniref:Uncharacterized protein n=1 Tax=Lentzea tibetensis TaxID=2591470 RepID=A0A563F010_9PSEU|nr:hypothetical protein [Lentzea tibetensis]TWP53223.1 hypothetical protein FKR81_04430 [Lentzea tibetensis]